MSSQILGKPQVVSIEGMRTIASLTSWGYENYITDDAVVTEYGATPEVLVTLWKLLLPHLPSSSRPHHMLWWLYLCKHYPTKNLLSKAIRVTAPTSRSAMEPVKKAFLAIRNKVVRIEDFLHFLIFFFNRN